MADPELLQAFRRLQRSSPTKQDLDALQEEVRGASDRATALLYAAALDALLEGALRQRMVSLSNQEIDEIFRGPGRPLAGFSAKINVGYALGVYGKKTKRDLHFVREIRNGFAHAPRALGFATKEIASICAALYYPDNISLALPRPGTDLPIAFHHAADKAQPRPRYSATCEIISNNILIFDIYKFDKHHRAAFLP